MSESNPSLKPFLAPLKALQNLLDYFEGRGVIIGGIATSLLGNPRFTADVDALILLSVNEIPELFEQAKRVGLEERISEAQEFARKNRVLLLRHAQSGIAIDISLGLLPFEKEMIAHSEEYQLEGIKLRLPSPENLIIMKAVAHRAKDLLDIQGIIQSNPNLDQERIQNWVIQFAEFLDKPELWEDIAEWF